MRTLCYLLATVCAAGVALGQAPSWPGWRGPYGSGAGVETGQALVTEYAKARQLWVSGEAVPGTYEGDARGGGNRVLSRIPGGYSSPVVAEGKVFLAFYAPNGPVYAKSVVDRTLPKGGWGREHWYTDADEVMLCLDATTGNTLWKRAFVESGFNLEAGFNKGGCQLTPCYADGIVYMVNTSGKVYAMRAADGLPVWESDIGIRARYQEATKEGCRELAELDGGRNDFAGCVMIADGVLAVSDTWEYKGGPRTMAHSNGLVGFDAKTGRRLWYVPGMGGEGMLTATPLRWTAAGKEHFIASGLRGVSCIEAATGKVLWTIADARFDNAAACDDTYLVCAKKGGGTTCYNITPTAAKQAWTMAESMGVCSPVIYKGHLYAKGKSTVACIELATGKTVATQPQEDISGSMIGGDGYLFCHASGRAKEGLNVFRMDPGNFTLVEGKRWPVSFANSTTPAYVDGRLYVRGRDRLYCYDLRQP